MQEDSSDRTFGTRPHRRTLILAASALLLAVVSALGVLDGFGRSFVADTMAEAIAILLVSMGFDAGVSALQDLPIVGAGLDPINDAVERLSTVMVWAIGSLLLQRTALEFVSNSAFQWGFVAVCVVVAALLVLLDRGRSGERSALVAARYRGSLVRVLVVAAMVRFFVPAFLAASAVVSNVVLQPEIDEHRATLEALSAEVFGGEESTAIEQPISEEQVSEEQTAAQQDAAANEALAEATPGDDQAGDAAPGDPEVAEPAPDEQGGFLDDLLGGLSSAQDAALDLLSGVNLPEVPDVILPEMPDLATVQAMAGEAMELLSRLLVAIAIKDIALPLVFLWIAVKAAVPIARWLIGLGTIDREESRELSTR